MRAVWYLLLSFCTFSLGWAGENSAPPQNLAALLVACRDGDDQNVRALLHQDQSLARQVLTTAQEGQSFTALGVAACSGYAEIVHLLLDAGADVNGRSGEAALTALLLVCMQSRSGSTELPADWVKVLPLSEPLRTAQQKPSQNATTAKHTQHLSLIHI